MSSVKNVFDFINDLCNDKHYRLDDSTKRKYDSFMVNRGLSQHADTLFFANEMNKMPFLDKTLQHDFYFHIVEPKRRYGKWAKAGTDDEVIALIIEEYNVNQIHARQYFELMSENDIKNLKEKYQIGGKTK